MASAVEMKTSLDVPFRVEHGRSALSCNSFQPLRLRSNGTTITLEDDVMLGGRLLLQGAAISANWIHLRSDNNVRAVWMFGKYRFCLQGSTYKKSQQKQQQ